MSYCPEKDIDRLVMQANTYSDDHKSKLSNVLDMLEDKDNYDVLDVGCGNGHLTEKVFSERNELSIYSIDKNKKCIEIARENSESENIVYDIKDVSDIIEDKKKYDIVFSSFSLQHMENPSNKLKLSYEKCLKEGGVIMINSTDYNWRKNYSEENIQRKILDLCSSKEYKSKKAVTDDFTSTINSLDFTEFKFDFITKSTIGMNLEEQKEFFEVFYSYMRPETKDTKHKIELEDLLDDLERRFYNKNVIDIVQTPYFIVKK